MNLLITLILVFRKKEILQVIETLWKNPGSRQSVPEVFDVNTIVWIFKSCCKIKKRFQKTIILKTDADRSIDIDTKNDIKRIKYF